VRTASAPWVAFHRSAGLPPGCFAVVMATGIVSVAVHQHRQGALSTALFVVALSTYAVLAALMLARRPRRIRRRLAAPSARLEALTVVAASAVPGVRAVLGGAAWAGAALGVVAVLAWAPLSIAAVAGVLAARQTWSRQASGTWLLLVVATESLAVLAATLATVRPSPVLAVAGTCWFALGSPAIRRSPAWSAPDCCRPRGRPGSRPPCATGSAGGRWRSPWGCTPWPPTTLATAPGAESCGPGGRGLLDRVGELAGGRGRPAATGCPVVGLVAAATARRLNGATPGGRLPWNDQRV
jgi:hypothetical protein